MTVQETRRYRTIVADPPWNYETWPGASTSPRTGYSGSGSAVAAGERQPRVRLPYPSMTLGEIKALPVSSLAEPDAHLFLWTTNRYVEDAYDIVRDWGFRPSQLLTWCKSRRGLGPGGVFANTSEFVIYARRGRPMYLQRQDSTWWEMPRGGHSRKPEAFLDLVEATVPGPYVELFARRNRLGWDTWGDEALGTAEMPMARTERG